MKVSSIIYSIIILLASNFILHSLFDLPQLNKIIIDKVLKSNILGITSLLLVFVYLHKKCPVKISHLGFSPGHAYRTLLWGLSGGIAVSIISFPYKVGNYHEYTKKYLVDFNESVFAVIIFVVIAVFLIPIFEEFIFRYGFYNILKSKYGRTLSLFIVSVLYSVMHAPTSIVGFGKLFTASLIYIFLYEETSKLGASILAHILCNSIWYSAAYLYHI